VREHSTAQPASGLPDAAAAAEPRGAPQLCTDALQGKPATPGLNKQHFGVHVEVCMQVSACGACLRKGINHMHHQLPFQSTVPAGTVTSRPRQSLTESVPSLPVQVLDAPGLRDDYYVNLLSWSAQNVIAVALHDSVWLWHGATSRVGIVCAGSTTIASWWHTA